MAIENRKQGIRRDRTILLRAALGGVLTLGLVAWPLIPGRAAPTSAAEQQKAAPVAAGTSDPRLTAGDAEVDKLLRLVARASEQAEIMSAAFDKIGRRLRPETASP